MLEVQDSSKITQVGRARLLLRVFSDSPPSPPKASHTIFQQGVLWVPHLRRTSSVSNQTLQDPKNLLNHRWAVATRHALEHASLGHWCNISTDSGLLHDFKISLFLLEFWVTLSDWAKILPTLGSKTDLGKNTSWALSFCSLKANLASGPTGIQTEKEPGKWFGTNNELGTQCLLQTYCDSLGYQFPEHRKSVHLAHHHT